MSRVVGIDPSLTGLAVWTSGDVVAEFASDSSFGPDAEGRFARYCGLVREVVEVVGARPDLAVVEGNQGKIQGNALQLVEFSWHLKSSLLRAWSGLRLVEVPPNVLKKWVTGVGNADKVAVASALTRKYGVVFESNNCSDAFGLMKFGQGLLGDVQTTKAQRAIYAKLGLV